MIAGSNPAPSDDHWALIEPTLTTWPAAGRDPDTPGSSSPPVCLGFYTPQELFHKLLLEGKGVTSTS